MGWGMAGALRDLVGALWKERLLPGQVRKGCMRREG